METTREELEEQYWDTRCQDYRDHDEEGNRRVLYYSRGTHGGTVLSPLSAVPAAIILRDLAHLHQIPDGEHIVDGEVFEVRTRYFGGVRTGEITVSYVRAQQSHSTH